MGKAMIVGVGMTRFGRHPDTHFTRLAAEAIEEALADAGMDFRDVQQAFCSRVYLPSSTGARVMEVMGRTGISCPDVEGACGAAVAGLRQAVMMVEAGQVDIALAFGVEKIGKGFMPPHILYEDWQCQMGMTQNPQYWALNAARHMHDYGTTAEQIAKVAVKAKRNGVKNPKAFFQREMTVQEVLASPLVTDPLRLYMLCSPVDGAAAVIVVSDKIAHRYGSRPVEVAACVHTVSRYPLLNASSFCSTPSGHPSVYASTSASAYEAASIGPEDFDLAEVQDNDAFSELEYYEELGFCAKGDGGRLIDDGATDIGGRLPVNTSGGLQAKGEPLGASHFGQIYEIVHQIRGQADQRQVDGARVGMAQVFGAWGHCGVSVLKQGW
ncbi:thiolase family protein [Sphingobium boeckii]|uniref:Acetyl-CoA acetyltransferase n=1 Tax=Sphingobium boeckii TaxID=1082345 RepID=A0A7W9ED75_9SPHN|nr:thiolase family protein [Sphingobium boeckii]MBB5684827.1 acetyl-CoA acetyltransferase [Sphingobium boeckii]